MNQSIYANNTNMENQVDKALYGNNYSAFKNNASLILHNFI